MKIGLPRGLLYYYYGEVWQKFFLELDTEVVISGETNKTMLSGQEMPEDVCLPVKIYFGHAGQLRHLVDYLFVPRVQSLVKNQFTCPKMIGLPDMLRNIDVHLPPLLDCDVNANRSAFSLYQAVVAAGHRVGKNALDSLKAWHFAQKSVQNYRPIESVGVKDSNQPCVAVVGHPYILYDRQAGMDIVGKLAKLSVNVITSSQVGPTQCKQALNVFAKPLYWSFCRELAGAALALLNDLSVSGMIMVTSFACGPDSLLAEIIKQQAEERSLPFMLLTMDEHTAEAGLITRLEAFTDMLTRGTGS